MKIKLLFPTVIIMLAALSMSAESDGIQTMLHSGHPIKDFVISYDERYILTRSESEVCVWDLNSRMLVAAVPMFTSEIFAHPTDSKLFYADVRHFEDMNFGAIHANEIIDWTTGKRIGAVSSSRMPRHFAGSDFTFALKDDNLLMFTTLDISADPVGSIGGINRSAGAARSNSNDSLLLTTGAQPRLWDLRHARLIGAVPYGGHVNNAFFQPRTDRVVLAGRDTVAVGADIIPVAGIGNVRELLFSGDKTIAVGLEHIYKSEAGKPFCRMPAFREASEGRMFRAISRTYGNGKFLIGGNNTALDRIEIKGNSLVEGSVGQNEPLRFGSNKYNKIWDIKIAPGDDYAVVISDAETVALLDLKTLSYTSELVSDYDDLEIVACCEILPDETVITGTSTGTLHFWKKGRAKSFRRRREHHAAINSITLSSDSTRMFTSDKAGQITVWDVKTLEPVVYIYQLPDDNAADYIFLTPDHYYKATPGISRHINFVKDGQPYAFEQFDLRNNRPDIVLERLGGDPAEIELLNKAWKKRLRRAGVSEESLSEDYHVPTVTVDRRSIPLITSKGELVLNADFADTQYNLSEISVTVNGVPVLSPAGRRVSGRTSKLTETIELASGNNEISVWCSNDRGASSLRETFNVTYTPGQPVTPDLYIVAAGVSAYADSRYNLGYAAKDAYDFSEALKERAAHRFGQVKTLTLTDSQVTAASLDEIRSFLAGSRPDDVALVFFAGHGVLDSELDYYLGAHDMDFANPSHGGIAYDDFMGVFEGVPALNRACFIDACHSGELDKEDYLAVNTVAMPAGEELVFRSAGQNVSAKEDIARVNTIIADMFADTRRGVGATVLSSAGGGELAVESPEWNNGLFTYCLLKGILSDAADTDHNGTTSLSEWINYTRCRVTDMSEGRQSPTLRAQNYHNSLEIK